MHLVAGPGNYARGVTDRVCVSNADAMSQIARPVYWLSDAFRVRQFDFETGREWYRQRVDSNWSQLIQPARDMIEQEYRFTRDLLKLPG